MTISSHFKHSLTAICTAIFFLMAGWFGLRHIVARQPQGVVLRPQDKERISYNSTNHILTVTTAKGTTRSYTRNPDVLIEKNGAVIVKKHTFGLEHAPFLGMGVSFDGISLKKNGYLGLNLLYAWRFDLGSALALGQIGVRPLLAVNYSIYSNSSVFIGYGFGQTVHAGISVRL